MPRLPFSVPGRLATGRDALVLLPLIGVLVLVSLARGLGSEAPRLRLPLP